MKPNLHPDPLATRSASSIPVAETRTGEPLSMPSRAAPPPVSVTSVRDPARYEIVGEHGRGGLGRVSRARDRELGRDVAIKELISRGALSEVRFLREALITARLEHPGIVPVHEAGRWPDGTPFYAMKLVAGRPLRDLIAERTTVGERIGLLHHVIAVADAIAYAHGRNIIHRDLKPANIIVGDFGETIVIDWGLAKDLTREDAPDVGGESFRANRDDDLTSAGSILGTPAYMSPEQARGEPVDQRADVFAIGAMLWELCALQKVPPVQHRLRHRILRRAGIDKDLAIIIDNALDTIAARRYPNAGALAADLKAFKGGARIAARSYSLLERVAHWVRRHRALTLSVGVVLAIALTGSALFIRGIARERDRADQKAEEATQHQWRAEQAKDDLTLQHAELLLVSDPTAAFELLAEYRGTDTEKASLIRAHAQGLGVARLIIRAHTGRVLFAHGLSNDELLTIGDHTIVKSAIGGSEHAIARNVTPQQRPAYDDLRKRIAYPCDPNGICILDAASGISKSPSEMASFAAQGVAFSPDGALLAAISSGGNVAIWSVPSDAPPTLRYQTALETGQEVQFLDNQTIVAITGKRMVVLSLPPDRGVTRVVNHVSLAGVTALRIDRRRNLLAVATDSGNARLFLAQSDSASAEDTMCKGAVNGLDFVPGSSLIAYACQDGDVGLWDPELRIHTMLAHLSGGANLAVSDTESHVFFGGNSGDVVVCDRDGGNLTTLAGHTARITVLLPATSAFPYVVSGDSDGVVRVWPAPSGHARVLFRSNKRLLAAIPIPGSDVVLGVGIAAALHWSAFSGRAGELKEHDSNHMAIALSNTEPKFGMYLYDSMIELWSFDGKPSHRVLKTDHKSVSAMAYLSDGSSFVTGGRDGKLVAWSVDTQSRKELGQLGDAIESLRIKPNTRLIIAKGASGVLWKVDETGVTALTSRDDNTSRYRFSHNGLWLATGTESGKFALFDTRTWTIVMKRQFTKAIIDLKFSAADDEMVAAGGHSLSILNIESATHLAASAPWLPASAPWRQIDIKASQVEFSADGHWLGAIGEGGGLWFYSIHEKRWRFEFVNATKIVIAFFSADSRHFVATDSDGRVWNIEMNAL